MHLAAKHVGRIVMEEVGAARVAISLDQSPTHCQQQCKRQVRRRSVQHVGRVADRDAPCRRGRHVDMIHADSEIADDAHPRQPIEQRCIDMDMPIGVNPRDPIPGRFPGNQLDAPGQHLGDNRPQGKISKHKRKR